MVFCSLTRNTLNFAEQHGNTNSALFREILRIPRQKVQFLSVCSIFYRRVDDVLEVVRVLHGARDYTQCFD